MFFEPGFMGTRAPMYLDIVGVFFFLLPFLLFFSIRFAVKGNIKAHLQSQVAIFIFTLIFVVIFEVGMRMAGGFKEYMKASPVSHDFFIGFLIVHVLVAIATFNLWSYQLISSVKAYRKNAINDEFSQRHRKIARFLVGGIFLTIAQGVGIYYFLFIMA
jgi:putative membrane protein